MTWWATVAAVRIHGWIVRTPKLSHLRGASKALKQHTSPAEFKGLETSGLTVSAAYSSVDGVVVGEAQTEAEARSFVIRAADQLGERLPGVQWEGWWCEADTYTAAFAKALEPGSGARRLVRLPVLPDNGLVKSCLMCRSEPAAGLKQASGVLDDDSDQAVREQGADCRARSAADKADRLASAGASLRAQLAGRPAEHFEELARKGGLTAAAQQSLGRKDSRNHLATIYADGNGMGAFFHALANTTLKLPTMHKSAIQTVNDCTAQAVLAAASVAAPGEPSVAAVEPHFVGGDDVLVSVPAPLAWAFVGELTRAFSEITEELRQLLEQDLRQDLATPAATTLAELIDGISISVGMTIAQATYPFIDAHDTAARALRQAKKSTGGRSAVIGWVDLTAQDSLSGQSAFLIDAGQARAQLAPTATRPAVFKVAPSARAQLAAILRDRSAASVRDEVEGWAKRQRTLHGFGKDFVQELTATTPDQLSQDLSRARWWPGACTKED